MSDNPEFPNTSPDANVERNRQMLLERSIVGFKKYGVTTERTDLTLPQWVQHAIEEVLDLANYLQAVKSNLEKPAEALHENTPQELYEALEWLNVVATSEDSWYPEDKRHAQVLEAELKRLRRPHD